MTSSAPARLTSALLVRQKGRDVNSGTSGQETIRSGSAETKDAADRTRPMVQRCEPNVARATNQGRNSPVRVTVRLDATRHWRAKITAAHLGLHLQEVFIAALDNYLEHTSPEILNKDCRCLMTHRTTPRR